MSVSFARVSQDRSNLGNYCLNEQRPERTLFDTQMQNMWCSSCCEQSSASGPSGPSGPSGGPHNGPNTARYSASVEDSDFRGNVRVAGVN